MKNQKRPKIQPPTKKNRDDKISGGLYNKAYRYMEKINPGDSKIIPFPLIFKTLGPVLSLKKLEIWEIIFTFRDVGWLTISPTYGVILIRDREDAGKFDKMNRL